MVIKNIAYKYLDFFYLGDVWYLTWSNFGRDTFEIFFLKIGGMEKVKKLITDLYKYIIAMLWWIIFFIQCEFFSFVYLFFR